MLFMCALLLFVLGSSVAANPITTPHISRRGNVGSKSAASKSEASVDVSERINGFWFTHLKVSEHSPNFCLYESHIA